MGSAGAPQGDNTLVGLSGFELDTQTVSMRPKNATLLLLLQKKPPARKLKKPPGLKLKRIYLLAMNPIRPPHLRRVENLALTLAATRSKASPVTRGFPLRARALGRWIALPLMLCLAATLSGCGGGGSKDQTSTVTVIESAKIARASAMPAPNSAAERAEATVHRYYRAIESGHYSQAWGLLDTALQSELGGYSAWRDGYETTVATEVFGVHAVEASGSSALVALKIESTDIDECGSTIAQSFAGTWSLASSG